MPRPLVSICIPCHNAAKYVEETIHCLLEQSYRNIEIIIIDDHSEDNSYNIVNGLKKNNRDKIFLYQANKRGAAAARNQAFTTSKGQFIVFFDADDLIDPGFIEHQAKVIEDNTTSVVVSNWGRFSGNISSFKEDYQQIKKDLSFKEWVIGYWTNASHTTPPGRVMMNRDTVLKTGLWDESLSLNDDFQFFSQIFYTSNIIRYNQNSLFKYRSNIGGLSSRNKYLAQQESNLKSLMRGIELALSTDESHEVKLACANLLQNFIYECYPKFSVLREKAEALIRQLGGYNLEFPCGGITKTMVGVLGWKLTKRVKGALL